MVAAQVEERRPHELGVGLVEHHVEQLLFVGRMDPLKGGRYFLDALPRVAGVLTRRIDVTFIGDGPARASWQTAAEGLMAREDRLRIDLTDWLEKDVVDARLAAADLLVTLARVRRPRPRRLSRWRRRP
jgi:glycosyltransferase involved in cell wall biosynthesis